MRLAPLQRLLLLGPALFAPGTASPELPDPEMDFTRAGEEK
jgi:hypothetical protein